MENLGHFKKLKKNPFVEVKIKILKSKREQKEKKRNHYTG
jgi:hypothetical protein